MRVKRPYGLTIAFQNQPVAGAISLSGGPVAVTLLDGEEHRLTAEDLVVLAESGLEDWVDAAEVAAAARVPLERVTELAERGLLISECSETHCTELRRRDELLSAQGWDRWAAVYHFTSRWRDRSTTVGAELEPVPMQALESVAEEVGRTVSAHGPPPPPFPASRPSLDRIALPSGKRSGGLFALLLNRKTTRLLDRFRTLRLGELATLLTYVWGCQGYARLGPELVLLRKTSPSAGGMHPVEVYPLVRDVDGLDPGLYHYRVQDHTLERLQRLPAQAAGELISELGGGQEYLGSAHVAFILTVRFHRSFWKFRHHPKAYRSALMDAAHLSQTLYLVATRLGLGAFVTTAVNEMNAEEILGLDPYEEGVVAMCGCGVPLARGVGMTLACEPYDPGVTEL